MSGKITLLIGLPRSGKSTVANLWLQEDDPNHLPRLILSGDDIRRAISGERFNAYTETMVWAVQEIALRALYNRGHHILLDDTHTSFSSIVKALYIDPDLEIEWLIPNKEVNSEEFVDYVKLCKSRAVSTNQADLSSIIDRMAANLGKMLPDFDKKLAEARESARNYQMVIQKD